MATEPLIEFYKIDQSDEEPPIRLTQLSQLPSGQDNEVWEVALEDNTRAILKLFGGPDRARDPESLDSKRPWQREQDVLGALQYAEIPGRPRPFADLLAAGQVLDRPAVLESRIPGETLDTWMERQQPDFGRLTAVLNSAAEVISLCNSKRVLHADVAARNILIDTSDNAYLIDFNMSKLETTGRTTKSHLLLPAGLPRQHPLSRPGETSQQELLDSSLPFYDSFLYGQMIETSILAHMPQRAARSGAREILQVFADETRYWSRLQYWHIGDLQIRVRSLLTAPRIAELGEPGPAVETVNLSTGPVPLTPAVESLIDSPLFGRMRQLRQLSLIRHIHAGAEHSRWEHLVHTYDIARRLARSMMESPIFRLYMDTDAQRRLIAAALLHDVNHFPFMHYLQESLPREVTNEWVVRTIAEYGDPTFGERLSAFGLNISELCHLLFEKPQKQETPADQVISSIINSAVDIDKLSYLVLDSLHCGVKFGQSVEIDTMLRLSSIEWTPGDKMHIALDERAIPAVDSILIARSSMFQAVYWHRINRAMMAMIMRDYGECLAAITARILQESEDDEHVSVDAHEKAAGDIAEAHLEFTRRYVVDNIEGGEHTALSWLNDECRRLLHRDAISASLQFNRASVYKRIITIKPERDTRNSDLVGRVAQAVNGKWGADLVSSELKLLKPLREFLSLRLGVQIEPHELLMDLPKRKVGLQERDGREEVYVRTESGDVRDYRSVLGIAELPGETNLRRIGRHLRIFTTPEIDAKLVGLRDPDMNREMWEEIERGAEGMTGVGGLD